MLLAGLVGDPALCLVDEPTNGLDPDGMKMLSDLVVELRKAGRLIVIATHDLKFADRLAALRVHLHKGELVELDQLREDD